MKKHSVFILLWMFLIISACQDDKYPINSLADVSWHLSSEHNNRNPIIVPLNKHLSLMDISQGELSHIWEVTGEGIYFLKGEMGYGAVDYGPLIDHSASNVTDNKTIHLYFTKPGQHQVRLRNTFAKQVSYTYEETVNGVKAKNTVYGKEENGVFVVDTTFMIDVYDPILVPMAKVYLDPECTQEVETGINEDGSNKQVTIEYGDKLYFKDASYDRPNVWNWTCKQTGATAEGENAALEFKKMSDAATPLNVTLKIQREAVPNNKYIPTAVAQDIILPLDIIVTPSTKPLSYDIKQLNQTTIQILLGNAEFVPAKVAEETIEKLHLRYVNDYKNMSLIEGTVDISSIAVDTKNSSILNITLAENIYNTDRLFFYCDMLENITIDGRGLEIAEPVEPNVVTTYAEYFNEDFEDMATKDDWYMVPGTGVVTDVACEYQFGANNPDKTGLNVSDKCFYVNASTNDLGGKKITDALLSKEFNGGTSTYTFRYKYKVTSGAASGLTTFFVLLDKGTQDKTWTGVQNWETINNTSLVWKQIQYTVKGLSELENLRMSLRFNAFHGEVYFDDFYFGNEEVRPRN